MEAKLLNQLGKGSGQYLPNGSAVPNGNHVLGDELSVFESESFDADAYVQGKCQSMSEKGIRRLCAELEELKKESAEEMRKSVYANYSAFIRTSREISDLESELLAMRNLLTTQATLIHGLTEIKLPPLLTDNGSSFPEENGYMKDDNEASALEYEADTLPDKIDVYIAEREIDKALAALEKGESLVASLRLGGSNVSSMLSTLENGLSVRKIRLAEYLAEAAKQPSICGAELRSVISALNKLGDGPRAHTLLLHAYHERLKRGMSGLRPSAMSHGRGYTASLSRLVFSGISQAAKDSCAVFGEESPHASELVLWAHGETEKFVSLIKKHVLSSSAASGGLRAAAECVQIALGHCELLEDQGLALCPMLAKLVKPSVEQALDANIRRIQESVSILAAADDWTLSPAAGRASNRILGLAPQLKLSTSAHRFIAMVQDFIEDVLPLSSMHLTSTTLDGLARLFDTYVGMLMRAMPAFVEDEDFPEISNSINVKLAETDAEKLSILANAQVLSEELLPRAILKILPSVDTRSVVGGRRIHDKTTLVGRAPEQKDFRRRLQRAGEKLRDRFCRANALELIYASDDEEPQLSAEMYLRLDGQEQKPSWHDDPMPSPIFQALFEKFNAIVTTAADVLAGRDRMLSLLLTRLVETFLIWVSDDPDFWEDIEDGPVPLGPNGLQQIYFDMHFILQMLSPLKNSPRQVRQVISEIKGRATEALAATGLDPNSVLFEEQWYESAAEDAVRQLKGNWMKDPSLSPSPSISTSSIRSHGSP